MVAAAIIGGAVVGAAGTAVAGSEASSATSKGSKDATKAQREALQHQDQLTAPYRALGEQGIGSLSSLLGFNGQDPTAALRATPGYKFTQKEGLDATKSSFGAMGLGLSGNTLEGLDEFSTGLADSTFQSAVNNAQNAVGIGQASAAGQAANIGNAAGNIGNIAIGQGNTLAGIDANTIAGITRAGANATNQYITQNTLQGLMNQGGLARAGNDLDSLMSTSGLY